MAEAHGLSRVITDADRRITRDYSVNATPLAFVVDRTATVRAKGVVNDDGDITHLLQLSGFAVDKEKGSKPSPARRGFSLAGLLGR